MSLLQKAASSWKKAKTALALGSGSARGIAHVGVIKALLENGVKIDMIAGASMGSLVGAAYAREGRIDDIEHIAVNMDWKKLMGLADPHFFMLNKGFIHGEKVKKFLKAFIGDVSFSDLKIPFSVVVCDLKTGGRKVINKGSVVEAVMASISIPGIFTPVPIGGSYFVDGGVVEPVPAATAREMGADRVIACNVIRNPSGKSKKLRKKTKSRGRKIPPIPALTVLEKAVEKLTDENIDILSSAAEYASKLKSKLYKGKLKNFAAMPGIFETILKAVYIMEYEVAKENIKLADMVISPDTSFIGLLEFYRGAEAVDAGYRAALEVLKDTRL
ncbi:MAG: patatin-like phospholipase family protein [Elusimicrobiota bacterium]|nr:patatin-like phospholipase family protein [Elusimicrobiota bacterium]